MTQLNSIIRRTDRKEKPANKSEKRVIFGSNGEVLQNEPSRFSLSSAEYFLVTNSNEGQFADHTSSSFKIEVFGQDKYIEIKILSKVGCIKDMEEVAAKRLGYQANHSPELTFNDHLREWTNNFIGINQNDFIDNFYRNQYGNQLINEIKNRAKEIGMEFREVRYYLEGQDQLKTLSVQNDKLETRFKDSVENHTFTVNATLLVNEERKMKVISTHRRQGELERFIYEHLKEYFPEKVEFESFASKYSTVISAITKHLDKLLETYGRKIGVIKITCPSLPEAPMVVEKDLTVTINTPEYPKPIRINSKVLIKRVDIAKFINYKPENLDEWLQKQVEATIASSFFGFKYSEIKERFETLKSNIKDNLKGSIYQIGYDLEQILVIPSFDGLNELEKIEFKIEETFITNDQEQVKLKTELNIAVKNLKKVSQYIDNNKISNISVDLKELCKNEIKQYIHSVHVEEFHRNFESAKSDLTNLIKEEIFNEFGAEITYIFFDRGEEEVIRKMALLKKVGWTKFQSEILSVIDFGAITFYGEFLVESGDLELWQIFRNQDISIENLKEGIQNSLISKLKTKSSRDFLGYKTDDKRLEVHGLIERIAIETIKSNFGINIKISNIDRNEQDWEIKMGINRRKQILETIGALHEDLLDATAAGLYAEAKDINKRLDNLHKEIKKLDTGYERKQLGEKN